ncbi:hypothetical protein [Actinoplanes sp. NPDC049265]|uniref:hypothetical protein n=1 Tax=Actinoplanes sp. NPDC049265 TaxID=3363902 RepID=UPI0037125D27
MRPLRHAVAALAVAGLLGGCSGSDEDFPRVASLRTSPPPASTAATGEDQRPLVPVDATNDERERLQNVWMDCVAKTFGPGYENSKIVDNLAYKGNAKAKKVLAVCAKKRPESYEERQKRTDISAFRDNQRQWYQCAQKAGYKLTAPNEDGEFGLTEIGPNGDFESPRIEACRVEAFRN